MSAFLEAFEAGRAAWPDVTLEHSAFVRHLMRHGADPSDVPFAADLYLAAACAERTPGAVAYLERRYLAAIDRGLQRVDATLEEREDARQRLYERLLTGPNPKIADYAGTGPLKVWLRVAALRTLQNVVTRRPKERPIEASLFDALPAGVDDPELAHMRELYKAEFRSAFSESLAGLSADDRALLSQRFIGGLTQPQLAEAYGVHVNTIARWLARAREALETGIRRSLESRLSVSADELRSILRLVRSQLDVSLGEL